MGHCEVRSSFVGAADSVLLFVELMDMKCLGRIVVVSQSKNNKYGSAPGEVS